jgi:hypothetical protein
MGGLDDNEMDRSSLSSYQADCLPLAGSSEGSRNCSVACPASDSDAIIDVLKIRILFLRALVARGHQFFAEITDFIYLDEFYRLLSHKVPSTIIMVWFRPHYL